MAYNPDPDYIPFDVLLDRVQAEADAHPFDPATDDTDPLAFTPVPLVRARHNGWSAIRQRKFLELLAQSGTVAQAAKAVGMSAKSAYALRKRPGAESFAKAWDDLQFQAQQQHFDRLMDIAMNGRLVPVRYRGKIVDWERRHDDRLLLAAAYGMHLPRKGV